jgi:hypothetical protein
MGAESSLPCSQKLANNLCREPEESTPRRSSYFPTDHFNIVLVHAGFPTRTLHAFLSSLRVTCFVSLNLLELIITIITDKDYKLRSFSLCSFPKPLIISSFSAQMFTSALCSEKPSLYVHLLISKTRSHTHRKLEAKL